jgi:hypothetical protein
MSRVEHPGICYCSCHDKRVSEAARERHVRPCCLGRCSICLKRYTRADHEERCREQREAEMDKLLEEG